MGAYESRGPNPGSQNTNAGNDSTLQCANCGKLYERWHSLKSPLASALCCSDACHQQLLANRAKGDVEREAYQLRVRHAARDLVDAEEWAKRWKPPADHGSLAQELSQPETDPAWRIKGLLGLGHNVIPVAGRKTGKTTLIGNLVRSLVDENPFLGRFQVTPFTGSVAIFNYEVDERQYRRWLRETGISNTDRVHVLHLRGKMLPLADQRIRAWTIQWLKDRQVTVWIPDPYSRAYVGSLDNGNDEAKVGKFLDTLDVIKDEAGVSELVMPVHTPKARAESGQESAIGSQRLEGWPDAMWYLTKDDQGLRYLRAEGRDIDAPEEQLTYDSVTRNLIMGGWDRKTTERRRDLDQILQFVRDNPGCSQNQISTELGKGATGTRNLVKAAEDAGKIRTEPGERGSRKHYVTGI